MSDPTINPSDLYLGAVIVTGGVRRYCSTIRPANQQHGLQTAFEFTASPGQRWCIDHPTGTLITDPDELTAVERIRQVLYRGPDGYAEPGDDDVYTAEEAAAVRDARYDRALHIALVGWDEHDRTEDAHHEPLDHWDVWLDIAERFDAALVPPMYA